MGVTLDKQVDKQAVWRNGLVGFAQAEQILREVNGIDISQNSIWCGVDRWGRRLQAIEALQ